MSNSLGIWGQKEFCTDSQAKQQVLYFIRNKEQHLHDIILQLANSRLKRIQRKKQGTVSIMYEIMQLQLSVRNKLNSRPYAQLTKKALKSYR